MGVTFTSNIGLAKPDETEVAENWANNTKLCEDNNLLIVAKTTLPNTGYTPTMIGQTTNPNIGIGIISGRYQEFQGFVWGSYLIQFTDPGVSAGSGEYGISLPFTLDTGYHSVGSALNGAVGSNDCIGEGYAFDATNVNNDGSVALDVVTIAGVSYMRMITELHTVPAKTSRIFRDGQQFGIATGDSFSGQFFFKKT